jgi:hypothetical protein
MKNLRYVGVALIDLGIIGLIFFALKENGAKTASENSELETEGKTEKVLGEKTDSVSNSNPNRAEVEEKVEWITYTDENLGYSFEYPSNYIIKKRP